MNKKVLIGLGVLTVAGIGYYMWKKNSEKTSSITAGGEAESKVKRNCVTTCESTPRNPNQSPTVYDGACPSSLANQPYGGYKTVTRCNGGAETRVKVPVRRFKRRLFWQ
jgi:hypothetical protein